MLPEAGSKRKGWLHLLVSLRGSGPSNDPILQELGRVHTGAHVAVVTWSAYKVHRGKALSGDQGLGKCKPCSTVAQQHHMQTFADRKSRAAVKLPDREVTGQQGEAEVDGM